MLCLQWPKSNITEDKTNGYWETLSVSARMVMLFMKFYSEGEVGNMEVAGWGSGQGRGIVLFFKRKEIWACLNNKIKLPVEKLRENTIKRTQLEPLLRYLEVKKRWVF